MRPTSGHAFPLGGHYDIGYSPVMADGALNLTLSDYTVAKLTKKAEALGVTPEVLAATLLDQHLFDYDDFTWTNGDPRAPWEPVDEAGARDWDEVRPELEVYVEAAFARRK
ncbi:hypothetical protein [Brevundimonas sp.]|uniref:hypothetical protein n=1 Tax=Brevundimonas sp. TaxID=1871086 RepID=UPI00391AD9AE